MKHKEEYYRSAANSMTITGARREYLRLWRTAAKVELQLKLHIPYGKADHRVYCEFLERGDAIAARAHCTTDARGVPEEPFVLVPAQSAHEHEFTSIGICSNCELGRIRWCRVCCVHFCGVCRQDTPLCSMEPLDISPEGEDSCSSSAHLDAQPVAGPFGVGGRLGEQLADAEEIAGRRSPSVVQQLDTQTGGGSQPQRA